MCVHVCSCASACIFVSVCARAPVSRPRPPPPPTPPRPGFSESRDAREPAGWLAGHLLFDPYAFLTMRTHKHTSCCRSSSAGRHSVERARFHGQSRAPLALATATGVRFYFYFSSRFSVSCFSFDLAGGWSTPKSEKPRAGGTSWREQLCVYVFLLHFKAGGHEASPACGWFLSGSSSPRVGAGEETVLILLFLKYMASQKQKSCPPPSLCNQV